MLVQVQSLPDVVVEAGHHGIPRDYECEGVHVAEPGPPGGHDNHLSRERREGLLAFS